MRYLIPIAAAAALIGCNDRRADNAANGAAPNGAALSGTAAGSNTPSAGAPTGTPAAAYRPFFDQRWGQAGRPVTPAEVLALIDEVGPQQAVNTLNDNGEDGRWQTVSSGIAKGDPAWLAVAQRVGAGVDAGTATDFMIAIQDSVTTNPAGALRLMTQLGTEFCNEHGMEVPAEQARIYFETATAAVEGVTDPGLQQVKASCLAELRKGAAEYPGVGAPAAPPA